MESRSHCGQSAPFSEASRDRLQVASLQAFETLVMPCRGGGLMLEASSAGVQVCSVVKPSTRP